MGCDMTDPLTTLQDAVAARLRGWPFLCDVPVFTERLKDIRNEIEKALGTLAAEGKVGIFALVLTPVAKCGGCEVPGQPYFDDVTATVQIAENVTLNMGETGAQKPAPAVALAVAAALHVYYEAGKFSPLETKRIELVPDPNLVVYNVVFKTALPCPVIAT